MRGLSTKKTNGCIRKADVLYFFREEGSLDTLKKKSLIKDLIAAAAFVTVFGCVFCVLDLGLGLADEQFYYTIVKRILAGDRLFVDEWHLSQLFAVILALPCRLYISVTGSYDGIIYFMRCLFCVVWLLLGVYIYRKLKEYGFKALFFTLALCVFFPYYTFTYYSFAIVITVFVLVTLVTAKRPLGAVKLTLLGLAVAAAVVAEPILVLGFALYSLQVLILHFLKKKGKKKENASFLPLSLRTWLFVSLGAFIAFAAFSIYYLYSCGWSLRPLLDSVPDLFSGKEYTFDFSFENNSIVRFPTKFYNIARVFGLWLSAALVVFAAAAAAFRLFAARLFKNTYFRFAVFILSCALRSAVYINVYVNTLVLRSINASTVDNIALHGIYLPAMVTGFVFLLLQKERKPLCFAFWQTSVIVSLLVDFSSDFSTGFAGIIALFPVIIGFFDLAKEFFGEFAEKFKSSRKIRRAFPSAVLAALSIVCVLTAALTVFWSGRSFAVNAAVPASQRLIIELSGEKAPYADIQRGPLKRVKVSSIATSICDGILEDMDAVASLGDGPLYVDSLCPMPYLCVDNPVGIYSSFYVETEKAERLPRYWILHPETQPELIYIPCFEYMTCSFFDRLYFQSLRASDVKKSGAAVGSQSFKSDKSQIREKLEFFDKYFDYELIEGKSGYILRVTSFKK